MKWVLGLSPFYRWECCSTERVSKEPKVTQLVSNITSEWYCTGRLVPKPVLLTHSLCCLVWIYMSKVCFLIMITRSNTCQWHFFSLNCEGNSWSSKYQTRKWIGVGEKCISLKYVHDKNKTNRFFLNLRTKPRYYFCKIHLHWRQACHLQQY